MIGVRVFGDLFNIPELHGNTPDSCLGKRD